MCNIVHDWALDWVKDLKQSKVESFVPGRNKPRVVIGRTLRLVKTHHKYARDATAYPIQ